jgi:hypothetical protein
MVSTKSSEKTLHQIQAKLSEFGSDMLKIEYLENCLKQLGVENDAKRFSYLTLADLYAGRTMWGLAAKNMDFAAEAAVTYADRINFFLKEIYFLVKISDYLMIDKAFRRAMESATIKEKEMIKSKLKSDLMNMALEYEKRNKRSSAAAIYEHMLNSHITTDEERKQLIDKLAKLNSGLGRLKEAIRYETMAKKPLEPRKYYDADDNVKKFSFEDLGIERVG